MVEADVDSSPEREAAREGVDAPQDTVARLLSLFETVPLLCGVGEGVLRGLEEGELLRVLASGSREGESGEAEEELLVPCEAVPFWRGDGEERVEGEGVGAVVEDPLTEATWEGVGALVEDTLTEVTWEGVITVEEEVLTEVPWEGVEKVVDEGVRVAKLGDPVMCEDGVRLSVAPLKKLKGDAVGGEDREASMCVKEGVREEREEGVGFPLPVALGVSIEETL